MIEHIAPTLVENIDLINSDLSVESLRALSEISVVFYNKKEPIPNEDIKKQFKSLIEISFIDK